MQTDEKVEYWATPLLTKRGSMVIAAPQKSMKTYFGLQLGLSIATGTPFFGWPTERGRVQYIDWEIGVAEAKKRLDGMRQVIGSTDNFIFTVPEETALSLDTGTVGRENLHDLLDKTRPDVVFFDTLRQATRAEENSSTEMIKALASLRQLQEKFNFASVLIHHKGKPNQQYRDTATYAMRGSTVVGDFVGTIGIITKHDTPKSQPAKIDVNWTFRNSEPIDPFQLEFEKRNGIFVRRHHEKLNTSKKERKTDDLTTGLVTAED